MMYLPISIGFGPVLVEKPPKLTPGEVTVKNKFLDFSEGTSTGH
jgi:hypothetical protein